MLPEGSRPGVIAAVLISVALVGAAAAQEGPGAHDGHHPEPPPAALAPPVGSSVAPSPAPLSPASPSLTGGQTGGGCGAMMGCMGSGPRPFYAALLDMPVLTAEARRFIQGEADRRIGWGSQAIISGQAQVQQALAINDSAALRQAATGVREGLLQLESGTAALRALEAGTPPPQFAITWFRDQLGVAVDTSGMIGGFQELSWYHLTSMAFLVAFLLGAFLIQYSRMHRIGGLVQRLEGGNAMPLPGLTPPSGTPSGATASIPSPAMDPRPAAQRPNPSIAYPDPAKDASIVAPSMRQWSGSLQVALIFRETPDVKTFRLVGKTCGPIPFTFLPGQFLTFSAELNGKRIRRSYTIASSPTQRDFVELTVKREAKGAESRYLHDHVAVGDSIEVSGPSGSFTFEGTEADSIVLISGGVGITPMMCVTRYLTDRSFPGDIFFLYGARTERDFIFREELDYLRKRHPNLHVGVTMESAEGTSWTGPTGRISKKFIADAVPDIGFRRVHVCGPPGMMEAVKASLLELGVAAEKIRTEAFGPAKGRVPPEETPVPVAAVAPIAPPSAPTALPSATSNVEFTIAAKTAPLAPDQSVLEAAEAIGVEIDYSCRVGTCGICVVPLKSGTVTMDVQDGLPAAEKARGMILACQAKSIGSLVVEA